MYSGLISKIEKARLYAQEPYRVTLLQFTANFHGDHSDYTVTFDLENWTCSCSFYARHNLCSHTMALQQLLGGMVPVEGAIPGFSTPKI